MRAKQLAARKARNRELAELDASRRCAQCKRDLHETGQVWEGFLVPGKFCSEACLDEAARQGEAR